MGACFDSTWYLKEKQIGISNKTGNVVYYGPNEQQVKDWFRSYQEDDRHENGHSYSGTLGMCKGLEFHNKTFTNIIMAQKYLSNVAEKWGAAIAVKYYDDKEMGYIIGGWCSS